MKRNHELIRFILLEKEAGGNPSKECKPKSVSEDDFVEHLRL